MDFNQILKTRRSIRRYDTAKPVTKEQLEQMLQAAIQAPSWKNSQTARYYIVTDTTLLHAVKKECLPEFNADNVADAPALIVTSFVKGRAGFNRDGVPDNECGNGWGFYDLGLHNANLVLKATELGLDTLIMGIRDADKLRELLAIDEAEEVVAVIGVGYRVFDTAMPKRKTVEDIAKFY